MSANEMREHLAKAKVISHRGASAFCPENTLSAFVQAAEMGAEWVELDAMLSKDAVPMVFHDDTLERMTNGKGRLDEFDYSELSRLKIKDKERIPTLSEVLSLIFSRRIRINIEIKPSRTDLALLTAEKVMEVVERYVPVASNQVLFSSFDWDALIKVRERAPGAHLAVLVEDPKTEWLAMGKKLLAVSINFDQENVSDEDIAKAKENEFAVLTYTVNQKARAEELFKKGVGAVFSDYPHLLKNK